MSLLETLTYENLIAGDEPKLLRQKVTIGASQTIVRGDLLRLAVAIAADVGTGAVTGTAVAVDSGTHVATVTEGVADVSTGAITLTPAANFVKSAAVADVLSIFCIASEDVVTAGGETAEIVAYFGGEFDEAAVNFGGASTAAQNKAILASKGIMLRTPAVKA